MFIEYSIVCLALSWALYKHHPTVSSQHLYEVDADIFLFLQMRKWALD